MQFGTKFVFWNIKLTSLDVYGKISLLRENSKEKKNQESPLPVLCIFGKT